MVSNPIRKQVEEIQEYDFKKLKALSILVFALTLAFFYYHVRYLVVSVPFFELN